MRVKGRCLELALLLGELHMKMLLLLEWFLVLVAVLPLVR